MRAIKKEDLDYFYHLQIPRSVWSLFVEKKISQSTFKVYVELFDRLKLSSYNGWIDKEGDVYLKYSYPELMTILGIKSKGTISTALNELRDLNLIIQKKGYSTSSKFYLTNVLQSTEKLDKYEKTQKSKKIVECTEVQKIELQKSEKLDSQKSKNLDSNNNNYNHNNLIITTTNQDNINYKDQDTNQPEKVSSSSFEKNIKEIKKYLLENVKDIPTCKNIMFLVENIGLSLERIKEVVNYATKSQKGIGFIYKALEENWTLKDITYSTEKNISTTPTARGHKFNSEAIDSTIEAKEAKEEYTAKIDRLQGIYQVLSDSEKKKIDDDAYQLAVEQYGVTVAKIMARTKTKFEILEKYYLLEKGA
ncbi:replication initiator protein A [Cetobacterium sp.]|uniref:replication initiator protein A n=1 Tax=Cetobacterium sp. TaxID=2071632 RepID=UPI003AF0656F